MGNLSSLTISHSKGFICHISQGEKLPCSRKTWCTANALQFITVVAVKVSDPSTPRPTDHTLMQSEGPAQALPSTDLHFGAFSRGLSQADLLRPPYVMEVRNLRTLLSTLILYLFNPSPYHFFFSWSLGPWDCKNLFSGLSSEAISHICANPLSTMTGAIPWAKMDQCRSQCFLQFSSSLMLYSKWLKNWLLLSFWFVVLVN